MDPRLFLTLPLLVFLGFTSSQINAAKPNNILFIYTDDHAPGMLGILGHPDVKTPHIDELYREGFHFTQGYNMGSMVSPVCFPSRAML